MTITRLKTLLPVFAIFLFVAVFISSCGDDEVTGCTDSDAENYDPEATASSGDCTYARDKFLGDYLGTFECPGLLALINSDSLEFSIQEGLNSDNKNEVIVSLKNIAGGLTFDLEATADGDVLNIEAELLGVPIMGIPGDVQGTGTAMLDATGNVITANLTLTVSVALLGINDTQTCVLVGDRI